MTNAWLLFKSVLFGNKLFCGAKRQSPDATVVDRLSRVGLRATATVVDNHHANDSDGDTMYTPVVEFRTEKRERIKIELRYSLSKPTRIGKQIKVIYDPVNPREAEVNSFFRLVFFRGCS